jgi:hypothetical protein
VLGSRSLKVSVDRFAKGSRYRVDARMEFTDGSFASFDVSIVDPAGGVVAEGKINAFEPEDGDIQNFKEGLQ